MALVLRADTPEGVRTLTLNRPEARNALRLDLLEALLAELRAAEGEARCVVLTGAGSAFCAGGDVKQMASWQGSGAEAMERVRQGTLGLLGQLRAMDAPVLAKVQGDCVGAGLGLALACDLVYASATARFGAPFANLGLVPDTALLWELPRRMGLGRAKELVFTGQLLQATEAWEIGLLNKVVPAPDLDDEVAALAARLAAMPTRTLGQAKRALQQGADSPYTDAVLFEAYAQGLAFTSPEHAEGLRAFLEKRAPDFRRVGGPERAAREAEPRQG